jgi:pyruvate dehydrogenase E1 component
MPRSFTSLGTDGYGRSDTREVLRRYFEVDAVHVVLAVLHALVAEGSLPAAAVTDALDRYGVDTSSPDPWST